jgi:hypothetical protein
MDISDRRGRDPTSGEPSATSPHPAAPHSRDHQAHRITNGQEFMVAIIKVHPLETSWKPTPENLSTTDEPSGPSYEDTASHS